VDAADVRSYHPGMPMWRCPHCGTPQAETARCWVCRRSSTTCSTCRHFRQSVAAQLGYCGVDRRRLPLSGLELRGCWEAGPARNADAMTAASVPDAADPPSPALRLRDFVPVELVRHSSSAVRARAARETTEPPAAAVTALPAPGELFRDPGRGLTDQVTLFLDADL
jgi:hypothetical protein